MSPSVPVTARELEGVLHVQGNNLKLLTEFGNVA
jgi:hypothetical protein